MTTDQKAELDRLEWHWRVARNVLIILVAIDVVVTAASILRTVGAF